MKEFVVGAPYTTETALDSDDEFLIVACDGVCISTQTRHQSVDAYAAIPFSLLAALGCYG